VAKKKRKRPEMNAEPVPLSVNLKDAPVNMGTPFAKRMKSNNAGGSSSK
jgi:hypothetical protein